MKTRNYITICFALTLLATGCTKVLDKRDLTSVNGQLVFNDSVLARTYVDYIYDQNLPPWGGTWGLRGDLSDESFGESKFFEGTLVVNDVADFGTKLDANSNYGKIRAINQFLQEVDKGSLTDSWKSILKGQVYFFRAWRYWELVKLYGGVPLVLIPQEAVGEEAKEEAYLPRNTTTECIAQIVSDLDKAVTSLPGKWTDGNDWARITSGAAAALKARVLLYWASPEFNPGDDANRWQAAYDASVAAKTNLSANGFGLATSFNDMWFTEKNNPEAVFVTGYNNLIGDQTKKNNGYDNTTRPAINGTGGGSNQPAKLLMEAFPMKDGRNIGDTLPGAGNKYTYNQQFFYKNRDPRFDKTIAFNGVVWPMNGNNNFKLWSYFVGTKSVEPSKPTSTGFYLRKAIDPKPLSGDVQFSGTDWMEIRYAEVLLNLAEAAVGVNKPDEAYTELIAVRKRGGIEAGTDNMYGLKAGMTRSELFTAILKERQIEFAFEGKRFWDLRRWKLIETVLNGKKREGITVTLKTSAISEATFTAQRENMTVDSIYKNYMTIATKVLDTKYAINWKPEYYYFALPQQAIDNNPKLVQNTGWGGTFDPLH